MRFELINQIIFKAISMETGSLLLFLYKATRGTTNSKSTNDTSRLTCKIISLFLKDVLIQSGAEEIGRLIRVRKNIYDKKKLK